MCAYNNIVTQEREKQLLELQTNMGEVLIFPILTTKNMILLSTSFDVFSKIRFSFFKKKNHDYPSQLPADWKNNLALIEMNNVVNVVNADRKT